MPQLSLSLLFLSLSHLSLIASLPALPDPALLIPSTIAAPSATAASGGIGGATTIPAFPEQSDMASSTCPLNPNDSLLPSLTTSCSLSLFSPSRCCPSLAAFLYSAYAATSLAARTPEASSTPAALPVLPDDAEACAGAVERVLRSRGLDLASANGANGTCDPALCRCGIRLRRLTCAGGAFADVGGIWAPVGDVARRIERDCARNGLSGCGRCLRALNLLKGGGGGGNLTAVAERKEAGGDHDRECQLMGLTWLLVKNGTRYMPTATAALRALMAADAANRAADPTTCSLPTNGLPLAVGSDQINGQNSSATAMLSALPAIRFVFVVILLVFFWVPF